MAELQARQAFLISLKLIGKFPFIPFLNNPGLTRKEGPLFVIFEPNKYSLCFSFSYKSFGL